MRQLRFKPVKISVHDGISVARDDLLPGGSKMRFIQKAFDGVDEVVYATPCEGGAQYALAVAAQHLGKRVTLFCAKRKNRHPRTKQAAELGARIVEIAPGYLSQVQSAAKGYVYDQNGILGWEKPTGSLKIGAVRLLPFGIKIPGAEEAIADAADALIFKNSLEFDEVWCAAGSGLIARGLAKAFPNAQRFAVRVGHDLKPEDVASAEIITWKEAFKMEAPEKPPFPSDPHYDAKAWIACRDYRFRKKGSRVLFWNVAQGAR